MLIYSVLRILKKKKEKQRNSLHIRERTNKGKGLNGVNRIERHSNLAVRRKNRQILTVSHNKPIRYFFLLNRNGKKY